MSVPTFLSDPALIAVLDALPRARIVGGAVRDWLAGRPVADIDLATPDRPEAVLEAVAAAGLRAVPTGVSHGTVTAISGGRGFEVTTLRVDVETDGRHAVVAFTDDWRADAARRDFTFNAMSMTRDGTLFDYFGGAADLRLGATRFVGDPATRIAEDYLRVLRFFRFHARYGTCPPDADTEAALRAAVPRLSGLSVERVWHELKRIIAAPAPVPALRLMGSFGVLAAVIPEGFSLEALERVITAGAPADPVLRVAALLAADVAGFADRLRLSNTERERLLAIRSGPVPTPGDDDAALRRLLADTASETLIDRCWLAGDGAHGWAALRNRIGRMERPVFPLFGRDVVALGVAPGPRVGALLAETRAWWMARGCVDGRDRCLDRLREAAGSV